MLLVREGVRVQVSTESGTPSASTHGTHALYVVGGDCCAAAGQARASRREVRITLLAVGDAQARVIERRPLERHALVERAAQIGVQLGNALKRLQSDLIGDVRGIGMLWAIEFVADRDTKRAFPREAKIAETIVQLAKDRGLVLWANVGHADGKNGDLVMIAPPFTIQPAEIDELVDLLQSSLDAAAERLLARRER